MELPLFLITGFHPAGFILGFITGLHPEVNPVFCMRTNGIEGLHNITADRLCVVSNPTEIPVNGIGIGRFMDERGHMRDGYEPYNELLAVLAANRIAIQAHPILQAFIDFNPDASLVSIEPNLSDDLAALDESALFPKDESESDPDLMPPVVGSTITEEVIPPIQETTDEHSGHAINDSLPSGEPQGDGSADPAGNNAGPITIGKRSKG